MMRPALLLLLPLLGLAAAVVTPRRLPSRGIGRDVVDTSCPPTNRATSSDGGSCLKYLGLGEYSAGADTNGWSNLAFVTPQAVTTGIWRGRQLLPLDSFRANFDQGKDTLVDLHGTCISACLIGLEGPHSGIGKQRPDCVDRFSQAFLGNATHVGLWPDIAALSAKNMALGSFVGEQLLSLGMTVSNLKAIVKLVKATWPAGIVYANFAWGPVNDPQWRDAEGGAFGTPGSQWHELDWLSYSFYRLTNQSWIQSRCEHQQTLYPTMAPHQRVLLQAGAWGSSSGPRFGWPQFVEKNCTDHVVRRDDGRWDLCSQDPFSCSNDSKTAAPFSAEAGLAFEVDVLLTKIGGRPCWVSN